VWPQALENVVDVLDGEHDAMTAQRVRRGARVGGPGRRRLVPGQFQPSMAVRGAHHRDVRSDSLEPDEAIHRGALDGGLAFQFQPERGEERLGRR
jgi:hypothetical protein